MPAGIGQQIDSLRILVIECVDTVIGRRRTHKRGSNTQHQHSEFHDSPFIKWIQQYLVILYHVFNEMKRR
jgi:hypothetical protein